MYVIDPSETSCSVPILRLKVISCSLSLINVCLPMILSLGLRKVAGSRVVSCSVDYDFVVLLAYIQLMVFLLEGYPDYSGSLVA